MKVCPFILGFFLCVFYQQNYKSEQQVFAESLLVPSYHYLC